MRSNNKTTMDFKTITQKMRAENSPLKPVILPSQSLERQAQALIQQYTRENLMQDARIITHEQLHFIEVQAKDPNPYDGDKRMAIREAFSTLSQEPMVVALTRFETHAVAAD